MERTLLHPSVRDLLRAISRIRGAAREVGLHEDTIRRYEADGLIEPLRDQTGCRLFTDAHLKRIREIALQRSNGQTLPA